MKFYRQYSIGAYIADFCCPAKKLVIEIDGQIHTQEEQKIHDQKRTIFIELLGFKILRFWNQEVENNLEKVLQKIKINLLPSPYIRRGVGGEVEVGK